MAKRNTKTKTKKQKKHIRKIMKGGEFTSNERQQLINNGFIQSQIDRLNDLGVTFNEIMLKFNTVVNNNYPNGFHGNSNDMQDIAQQVENDLMDEQIFSNPNAQATEIEPIPQAEDEQHILPDNDQEHLNLSQDSSLLHLSDLNLDNSYESNTTHEENSLNDSQNAGKRKKSHKHKKQHKKNKKTRKYSRKNKQEGGRCYGNGVGANSSEPNYSIYNTNSLKLFPYKP